MNFFVCLFVWLLIYISIYAHKIGVGFLSRKLANLTRPHLDIVKESDGYIAMKVEAPHKCLVNRFRINEYFNETRMDGKVCKVCVPNHHHHHHC